jgi:hypothetical protein
MTYKVVRNTVGDVVAFGPNEDSYSPMIKTGEVLNIENEQPLPDTQAEDDKAAARASALTKLADLGLTEAEVAAIIGG